MTDAQPPNDDHEPQEAKPSEQLESGTYEVIRNRLTAHGTELRERIDGLNAQRKEVFGSIETELLATARVTTDHNCVPRDIISIGNRFLFGYNVNIGLKTETTPEDVFAVYDYRDHDFHRLDMSLVDEERFRLDFRELYRYYRKTIFAKFAVIGPHLHMVFRIGESVTDVKTFKWRMTDDGLEYVDSRSDHEFRFPSQHDFDWVRTHRDLHRSGAHPHISIEDRLFVETVGGDLTVKVEDNTEDGQGIYAEPVDNPDQTLDDAEIFYATVGSNILLKIKPYQEEQFRYLVYSEKVQSVRRIDAIESACVFLPDDHGLIFSNGYYLETGELKLFDTSLNDMLFERRVAAPNGEDFLYVFYNRKHGTYVLLSYNVIEQEVKTPIVCNGFSLFPTGELLYFKQHGDPNKHHTIQIWQTPYVEEGSALPEQSDSLLFKIGNRDLVRGMAESHEVLLLIARDDSYANLYLDLVKKTADIIDSYYWITDPEAGGLAEPLGKIRQAASAAVDEFDKVVAIRRRTQESLTEVQTSVTEIQRGIRARDFRSIDDYVQSLAELRTLRGRVISLRDLRYIDLGRVDSLDGTIASQAEKLATGCVEFLLQPAALDPYRTRIAEIEESLSTIEKVATAREIEAEIDLRSGELELLIETVGNLKIDDATQRTASIDAISEIFAHVNQVRATLKRRAQELMTVEGASEFGSQLKLLGQSVVNYLDLCDTPEKCDAQLTKLMVLLEELEGRFAEFDDFVDQIAEKRQEIYDAFEARKLGLVETRNRRAEGLHRTADRILKGIETRLKSFDSISEINGYFASDLMVDKVRNVVEQLGELDDSVKSDEVQSRLKSIRENSIRQLKDRKELFVDGENVIRFGEKLFSVNVQPLDLTTVIRDGELYLHLTSTNYFERIVDAELAETRDVWTQELVSENGSVYRAEYLAYCYFTQADPAHVRTLDDAALLESVQEFAAPRYQEGYVKGVHDRDAAAVVKSLASLVADAGGLRYPSPARALAWFAWTRLLDDGVKQRQEARLRGLASIRDSFGAASVAARYRDEMIEQLARALPEGVFDDEWLAPAAAYVCDQIADGSPFAVGPEALVIATEFSEVLAKRRSKKSFKQAVADIEDPVAALSLIRDWVDAYLVEFQPEDEAAARARAYLRDEVAVALLSSELTSADLASNAVSGRTTVALPDLIGSHSVIVEGDYELDLPAFLHRLARFEQECRPRFELYQRKKKEYLAGERERIRLDEFKPRVLSSFVRNRLIDRHYLPLIGDNLAKQIGVAGADKRTDLMGLLLLVSPPGYGKTTLMEYVASRLGVTFVKINGPAIGHAVTSLDPNEAPNASAREEVEKLNLAFELGDNLMIYVDDIQHTHPEFLQKFISLCDGQRRIEGVFRGRTRTYDLRGKKVSVVMAGNPYTESGEKFQIPDMLANRADTYNLGDIIGSNAGDFKLSYIENCLTSNPVLDKLTSRSQKDLYGMLKIAETGSGEGVDFEGSYSAPEVEEIVNVLKKLLRIRDVILTVNSQYIASAGQSDDYRTEPPFRLQGSYRNMNKLAEKVLPVMNDDELELLIMTHYGSEAQTLTTGAEANLLKLKEMLGKLSADEESRWADIRETFQRNNKLRGLGGDDKFAQVVLQLTEFNAALDGIRSTIDRGISAKGGGGNQDALLATISEALRDRPSVADLKFPNVQVVNKVPHSFLNVIRQQFAVMQSWMAPIVEMLRDSDSNFDQLKERFDGARQSYDTLMEKLEEGEIDAEE